MGKNVFLTTILVFLIVADVSNAFFWSARKLTAPSPKEDPKATVSPIPSPVASEKQSNPVGDGEEKAKEKHDKQPNPGSTSGEDKSKSESKDKQAKENNTVLTSPPPAAKEEKKTPKEEVEEKKNDSPTGGKESCDGIGRRCRDAKSMVACVKSSDDAALKALVVLIMNEGDNSLNVDLTIPSSVKNQKVDIPKHQTRKVDISLPNGGSNEIILNSGNGDCVLHLGAPTAQGNFFQWIPSYSKFMTPVYGAYLFLLTTFIAGLIWACCWFRKRKRQSDIPYQELEMSVPESAVAVDTAEGWDQVWDDDWDEESAVRSPGGHNISTNGLTSRTPKKDGWEDWDD